MKKKHLLNSLALLITSLFFLDSSLAESSYKSHASFKTDFQSQEWNGAKITVGSIKGLSKIYGSSSSIMPNGEYIQNCLMRVVKKSDGTEIVTNCNTIDKDGDIFYAISERKHGDINSGGKGKTTFVGGTGKFQGANGSCEYSARYLPENWLSVDSECTLK